MNHRLALLFILFLAVQAVYSAPPPENIQRHDGDFSLGVNAKYNFMNYGSAETRLNSQAPVFLGLSFFYKDYGASFSIAHPYTYDKTPGKHAAFDVNLAFYQERWYEELSVKFNFSMLIISGNMTVKLQWRSNS